MRTTARAFLNFPLAAIIAMMALNGFGQQEKGEKVAEYPARYMGGEAALVTAPNGAVIYDKALEAAKQVAYAEKTIDKITGGIWVIGGYSIVNCIVVEAPAGLIVYDTGDNAEEGKHFRELIEDKIASGQSRRSSIATATMHLVGVPWSMIPSR